VTADEHERINAAYRGAHGGYLQTPAPVTAQTLREVLNDLPPGPWYVEAKRPGHPDEARIYDCRCLGVCKLTTGKGEASLRWQAERFVKLRDLAEQAADALDLLTRAREEALIPDGYLTLVEALRVQLAERDATLATLRGQLVEQDALIERLQ
jgi:hypothetical protein